MGRGREANLEVNMTSGIIWGEAGMGDKVRTGGPHKGIVGQSESKAWGKNYGQTPHLRGAEHRK